MPMTLPTAREHRALGRVQRRKRVSGSSRPHTARPRHLPLAWERVGVCFRLLPRSRQRELLRTARSVAVERNVAGSQSFLGRSESNLNEATLPCGQRASARILAGDQSEIAADRDTSEVQRRVSGIGEPRGLRGSCRTHSDPAHRKGGRRQGDGWATGRVDGEVQGCRLRQASRHVRNDYVDQLPTS